MSVEMERIKELRAETGVSIGVCKKALETADGDMDKAREIIQKESKAVLNKKKHRDLGAGVVQSYIHNTNQIGAMVELLSETDFVSKNEEFVKLAYNIAMHISAMKPQYRSREDIPQEEIEKIKNNLSEEIPQDKPKDIQEKILEGKIDSHLKEFVLLDQAFIKDETQTIGNMIESAAQKFGERIEIGEYSVYSIK